jgi:large conductance mechanosensitive channel
VPTSKKTTVTTTEVTKTTKKVKAGPLYIVKAGESQLKGFLDFIRTQGVVGLAVGLVLGGAVSILVKSLVDNVVMPPLGLILGSAQGLKGLGWTIGKTSSGTPTVLHYGVFLNDFINFIVIALVVYFIVRLLRFDKLDKKKE